MVICLFYTLCVVLLFPCSWRNFSVVLCEGETNGAHWFAIEYRTITTTITTLRIAQLHMCITSLEWMSGIAFYNMHSQHSIQAQINCYLVKLIGAYIAINKINKCQTWKRRIYSMAIYSGVGSIKSPVHFWRKITLNNNNNNNKCGECNSILFKHSEMYRLRIRNGDLFTNAYLAGCTECMDGTIYGWVP